MAEGSNRPEDFTEVVNKDDIFIAVMGLTGSGKSSLITECTGQNARIGHGLSSCTTTVSLYSFDHTDGKGKKVRVHLVDTPGFDDLQRSDAEILQEVVFWLSHAYDNGFFLNGIIHLQSIAAPRWTASSDRSLNIFKALCGPANYKCVVLATTFWDLVNEDDDKAKARERFNDLAGVHWRDLKEGGSYIQPASYGYTWASQSIEHFVTKGTKHVLQIQSEMRVPGANLRDTTAGKMSRELWILDEIRRQDIPRLDQTREQLFTHWTRTVNEDLAALTRDIQNLRDQISQGSRPANPPPYSSNPSYISLQDERQKNLRQQAKDLDRVKQVKLASYGMYVNGAAMIFGGIAAGLALAPLFACVVI